MDGWRPVDPVTVDRVGIYFRHASTNITGIQIDTTLVCKVFYFIICNKLLHII